MSLTVSPDSGQPGILVKYDGKPKPSFEPKIISFFSLVADRFPWLATSSVEIDSQNSFPHGAGIASSASAMSALALCLMDMDDLLLDRQTIRDSAWWQQVSEVARLGSGSACRSVFPQASIWGHAADVKESSDHYGIPWGHQLSAIYKDYQDTILIVSSAEKAVSSTAGHKLMDSLVYAETRYAEAKQNLSKLASSMQQSHDQSTFISIVESEALQLHALMMSGHQPFILMEPGTIAIIKEVWRFRKETGVPVCFTLDAGPNVHLLYPAAQAPVILDWIKNELIQYCANGRYILDHVGNGPEKVDN